MAEVYWIHLPEHTDMFSQGYIGFTSITTRKRWNCHKRQARDGSRLPIHRAIRKYGNNLIFEVICICDNEYGLWLENKLRPELYIGWNCGVGGAAPTLGFKHTEDMLKKRAISKRLVYEDPEYLERLSIAQKKQYEDNPSRRQASSDRAKKQWESQGHRERLSANMKIKFQDPLYRERWLASRLESIAKQTGLPPWEHNNADKSRWFLAQDCYNFWIANGRCGATLIARHFQAEDRQRFTAIYRKLKTGWVPQEDSEWVAWKEDYLKDKEANGT